MENKIDFLIENLWNIYDKIKNGNKYVRNLFPIFKDNNFKTKKELEEYIINNQQSLTIIKGPSLDLIATSYKNFISDANNYNNYIKKIKNIQLETQNKKEEHSIAANNISINSTKKETDVIKNEEMQNSNETNVMDTLEKTQNLYEINYKDDKLSIDDLKNIFNTIKSFYNRQDEMCKDNLDQYYIKQEDDLEFPKVDIKDNIYFSTDHHGDLAAFMFSLLESGVAKFKQNSCPVVYFSMKDKKIIDNVEEYIKLN